VGLWGEERMDAMVRRALMSVVEEDEGWLVNPSEKVLNLRVLGLVCLTQEEGTFNICS
jgi:hypothetical protein